MHIGIDCLVNLLPEKLRHFVKLLTDLILIATNIVMAYMSIVFTIGARMKLTSALRISYSFIDVAAAIAFTFMAIHAIGFFIEDLKYMKEIGKKDLQKGDEV